MFRRSFISENGSKMAIDITGKRYSDYGMMWNELCNNTGIPRSIIERYDDWFILDDGLYYFKDRCKIEELFISELAFEYKIRCVDFLLAINNGDLGIISKLYRENDKEYYMYTDFCCKYFNDIPTSLELFKLVSSIVFDDNKMRALMDDIYKLLSFDMLCGQWDREEYNFFFECDKDNNVRLAPLCDNGLAFQNCYIYSCPFGKFNLDEDRVFRGNLPFFLLNDIDFYNNLSKLLDIDLVDILNRTCEKYMIDISNDDRHEILSYFDDRKTKIDRTLKLVK